MTHTDEHETVAHAGHDLETGMLERVREWTDLFPWLRLIRTMRMAASPTLLSLTAATLLFWLMGMSLVSTLNFGVLARAPEQILRNVSALGLLWTILIWAPSAIVLTRQGGLLTAGRSMVGIHAGVRLGWRRSWRGWSSGVMPPLAALLVALPILIIGWVARIAPGQPLLEFPAALLSALAAIPVGIIAFGGLIAIPFSWAALGNEQDGDPLNALSRGYESLFRRPLHLAFYLLVGGIITWVIKLIADGIMVAAIFISSLFLQFSGCSPDVTAATSVFLTTIPAVVVTTLGWGSVGGIYLLLRYDTGGQEIEDLWEQDAVASVSLPELSAK